MEIATNATLIVVDVQKGFDDPVITSRGRNNPAAEQNIATLIDAWQSSGGRPVVWVRHTSLVAGSPLAAGHPGNDFQTLVEKRRGGGTGPEVLLDKHVNSAFLGSPDLDAWLKEQAVRQIVVVGIQTNWCVETTARMGGNLGYEVIVPLDATYTFGAEGPDGRRLSADELGRATGVNLHAGGFARVVTTAGVVAAVT